MVGPLWLISTFVLVSIFVPFLNLTSITDYPPMFQKYISVVLTKSTFKSSAQVQLRITSFDFLQLAWLRPYPRFLEIFQNLKVFGKNDAYRRFWVRRRVPKISIFVFKGVSFTRNKITKNFKFSKISSNLWLESESGYYETGIFCEKCI